VSGTDSSIERTIELRFAVTRPQSLRLPSQIGPTIWRHRALARRIV
jgi:hypothetical protein